MKMPVLHSVDFKIILVALLYYLSAELGFFLSFGHSALLPFWPPAGVALALVILFGRRVWPGIAIGSLIIVLRNFWFGPIESVQVLMVITSLITLGSVIEPLVGELMHQRLTRKAYPFSSTVRAFQFVLVALVIPWISAGVAASVLTAVGVVESTLFASTLFSLWARNTVGILLFTPLLLSIRDVRATVPSLRKIAEGGIFLLSVALSVAILSIEALHNVAAYAMPFVAIPFLLWLAFRFDNLVSILGIIAVSLVATYFTSIQQGPFFMADRVADSILLLQVYVAVVSISTLVLASAVRERQAVQTELKRFNENLEAIVQERTKALEQEVKSRTDAQKKLEQTNEELIKRNSELDNFVYRVSHDLRAPMASILGLINLAKKDTKSRGTLYLDMMEKSALQQDHFIREILDQSKNARLELEREPILFEPLIEEAFEQLRYSNSDGTIVEKIVSVDQEQPFFCDKWRLKVILSNIISNSIRYRNGKEPVIRIDAKVKDHRVLLSVEDNGKGISEEHISQLGKMFYRATDQGAGSGLGLYIVKEAIHRLSGSMTIESQAGHGTVVKFEIPEVEEPA